MAFSQVKFMGATVLSVTSSMQWNQEGSSVTIGLVEDKKAGDRFQQPGVGTPSKFSFNGFNFDGLVQRWLQKNAIDGNPTFEITLTDPKEILAGVQVILNSYRGTVEGVPNLINAYGYWEDIIGFGGAMINESGMLWNAPFDTLQLNTNNTTTSSISITQVGQTGILPAIQTMTQGKGTIFGGPISFHGFTYGVDLSSLPVPPAYYRIGGVASSILDMVSTICEDGGHDYMCYLDGNMIRFKTVSRTTQPDPGLIAHFINTQKNVISHNIGEELRNDVSNAILLGGDTTELVQEFNPTGGQSIWPFWGFDVSGQTIIGKGIPEVELHTFNLNATPIADIMGTLFYPCDVMELRCALMDFDSWAAYVLKLGEKQRKLDPSVAPTKDQVISLVSAVDSTIDLAQLFPDTLFQHDLIAADDDAVIKMGQMNESDYWTNRVGRVYEFVRQYAQEYFGKKFLVSIPFLIYWRFEPETTHVISSDEPTDAGFTPDGSMPLGLSFLNEDLFLSQDGRFQCFVRFSNTVGNSNGVNADLQSLPSTSCILQDKTLFVKATIDSDVGIIYAPNSIFPYCVVTLDSPLYEIADSPLGTLKDIATILYDPDTASENTIDDFSASLTDYAAALRYDSFPMKIHPAPYRPDSIALPMKSNRDSYGPWILSSGVAGKVSFERDEGLVPWNYGDYDTLNLAAQAKLSNVATAMQHAETGTVEIAGEPLHSLGDELVGGGPQLTGIDIGFSVSGVTTSYRMQTYTPRFGVFTRENADRLRRLGMAAQDMRRAVRTLFQRQLQAGNIIGAAQLGAAANYSRAVQQATPHNVLLGTMSYDKQYGYRSQVATQTTPEAVANARGDKDELWIATGCMSMEGLLRPFSTNALRDDTDHANDMPHYEVATLDTEGVISPIGNVEFDPFGDVNDIDYSCWGDKYPGAMHSIKKTPDFGNSRLLGLRGPLVMVGWGFTYGGKPIPNLNPVDGNESQWSNEFATNHRLHPELWKAGPIGLYWDNWRKLWTIPTVVFGTLDGAIGSGDSGTMTVDGTNDHIDVSDYFGGTYTSNQSVAAAYFQQLNIWYIIAAKCASG